MNMLFDFYNPTRILFGSGKLCELGRQPMPGKNAMVLISNGKSTRANGYLDRTLRQLDAAGVGYAVFDGIMENPVKDAVMQGAAFARKNRCDFIVALGGGAVLDASTAISAMATNDGDLWDYVQGGTGKGRPLANAGLPVVTIATTSGTGSEINCWGVISNPETKEKIGFGDPRLVPVLAVVDPELMLSVPPQLTAFQGFDAFFHASEGYLASVATPVSDALALQSMRLLSIYLPRAVADGSDLEARTNVALANTLSGMVESTSCCISEHSLEHAMSGLYPDLPHGAGLIMISLAYYRHFAPLAPARFIEMARNIGADLSCMREEDKPYVFVESLRELQHACGVDNLKMSDYGIRREDFPRLVQLARNAMGGLFGLDPAPLTDADIIRIFEESYK